MCVGCNIDLISDLFCGVVNLCGNCFGVSVVAESLGDCRLLRRFLIAVHFGQFLRWTAVRLCAILPCGVFCVWCIPGKLVLLCWFCLFLVLFCAYLGVFLVVLVGVVAITIWLFTLCVTTS